MASGRERLRNLAAATHPTYGETFLDQTDRSASSSGAASAQEHVPESQSEGRSSAQEYAAQEGVPPSLSWLYKTTNQHSDGTFVHSEAKRIYNDVETRIQEVQTQLSQQNPEAEPVQLSTVEQDKNFEHKRGQMVGISTVNDVPRARAEYAARMVDDSQLQTDLTAANRVISELRADSQANRIHIRSIAGMFDVLAETNPALASMWQNVRPTINPDPTLEEQADLEQRSSVHHSAEIFDDINLNN
ncbi:hypothetical protein F2Q69_00023139 [Brassica cretica]|uniref:Uncharacterized protein n=1 Tax=Brassica cretica TaxID=69181 RepID=A0A8S9Q365_BRACR|nr:hypothetical protein F2Q69_00023139 [Brassica cretica]